MKRTEKQTFVEDLRERVDSASVLYLTDFTGLDVQAMTTLRRRVRESGARYLVVKNRLVKRALAELDVPDIDDFLTGPTGVVLGDEGPVPAAKAITEFAKEHDDRPAFKVGIVDKKLVVAEQFERLARLPGREQLLAQIVGALEAPMAALAGALEGKLQEFAGLIQALKEKQEG